MADDASAMEQSDSSLTPAPAGIASPASGNRVRETIIGILKAREMAMVVLILITGTIMAILTPRFLNPANFLAIARGFSVEGIVVVGMAMLLVSGAFDLSVGSVMALSGIMCAWFIVKAQLPIPLAILGGVGVGALTGCVNGIVVTRIKVNALIATLGMMSIARGISLGFTEGHPVINLPPAFAQIGQGTLFNMPLPIVYVLVVVIVADVMLRRARWLRQLYYVGGSEKAARLSGINVDRVLFLAFVGSGVCAALAGIITTARLTSGVPTAFTGVELRVIAACVIGGCSLSGGEGTVLGAMLGFVFMALVTNAMTLFGVSIYWEGVVTGSILVVAVSLDMISRRRLRTS